jgi:hypothetical protein
MRNNAEKIHEVDDTDPDGDDEDEYETVQHVGIKCGDVEVNVSGVGELHEVAETASELFASVWERQLTRR